MAESVITTTRLVRRFGRLTAVDRIDLQVPAGSVYGFLGPNGAGKTTTIRMLLGLIRPDAGQVQLFGRPLLSQRRAQLKQVGSLVESPSIYPNLSGRENLEVLRRLTGARRAQVNRALQVVRLSDAAGRKAGSYSTGMKQRLGLAMALLRDPELLILDEPTNGLDPAGIHEIRDLLVELPARYGVTVFLSSHLLNEVEQVASHIGIIQQGRLCFQGTLDELHAEMEEQVVLGVDRPQEARTLLATAGWKVEANGGQRVTISAGGRADAALVNQQLVAAGFHVHHLTVEQPTLEDIFLSLTNNDSERGVDDDKPVSRL